MVLAELQPHEILLDKSDPRPFGNFSTGIPRQPKTDLQGIAQPNFMGTEPGKAHAPHGQILDEHVAPFAGF